MWQDPIIAELHQTREIIAQAYNNDLHAIFLAAQCGELLNPLNQINSDLSKEFIDKQLKILNLGEQT